MAQPVMSQGLNSSPLTAEVGGIVTTASIGEAPAGHIDLTSVREFASDTPLFAAEQTAAPARAVEYSDGYRLRAKIHRIASFAILPLFGTEAVLGQPLYSDPSSSKKDAHLVVAAGIGALFAVNTATGVWNLVEARKDPAGRSRRLLHGVMMLAAGAGFLATAALGPGSEHGEVEGSRGAHRAMAFTSVGLATVSYLVMLVGGH